MFHVSLTGRQVAAKVRDATCHSRSESTLWGVEREFELRAIRRTHDEDP
jgi:hypothetical protein